MHTVAPEEMAKAIELMLAIFALTLVISLAGHLILKPDWLTSLCCLSPAAAALSIGLGIAWYGTRKQ